MTSARRGRAGTRRHFGLLVAALLVAFFGGVHGLKFDLEATYPGSLDHRKCVSQFIAKDTLVSGSVEVGEGQHQRVDVEILDETENPNVYFKKNDINNEVKFSFTTHSHADVMFCFMNSIADDAQPNPQTFRTIFLSVDTGAEAMDYSEVAKSEKLRPIEIELRKLESVAEGIVTEMEYMKQREAQMRDTNESTNERVQNFSLLSIAVLIGLGVWQAFTLRRYFISKKLI
ncbi:endoplasmic reticulum vesicle protein 25 [Hyaloraphidium curvatum]|nr:endoplasmic reticulum vesicle protein 25 [Hyaloraphidium curvatum]